MNFVSIYCFKTTCVFNQGEKCSASEIEINSGGICETYEKEELPPYANPDKERI